MQPPAPASDVYARSLIAYEMLTGARPFNTNDPQELAALQQSGVKVKPSDLRPGLAKAVDDAIVAALAYDAPKRPASARAFGDALAQALTPQPPPPRMDKRWLAAAAVAGVLAVCLMSALWWNFASPTPARACFSASMLNRRITSNARLNDGADVSFVPASNSTGKRSCSTLLKSSVIRSNQ